MLMLYLPRLPATSSIGEASHGRDAVSRLRLARIFRR
jgi:hypothetical protein